MSQSRPTKKDLPVPPPSVEEELDQLANKGGLVDISEMAESIGAVLGAETQSPISPSSAQAKRRGKASVPKESWADKVQAFEDAHHETGHSTIPSKGKTTERKSKKSSEVEAHLQDTVRALPANIPPPPHDTVSDSQLSSVQAHVEASNIILGKIQSSIESLETRLNALEYSHTALATLVGRIDSRVSIMEKGTPKNPETPGVTPQILQPPAAESLGGGATEISSGDPEGKKVTIHAPMGGGTAGRPVGKRSKKVF